MPVAEGRVNEGQVTPDETGEEDLTNVDLPVTEALQLASGSDRRTQQREPETEQPAEPRNPVSPLAELTLGGRYRLEHLIGSGGMAQVWAATDLVLDRKVAVKVLHPHLAADASLVARFRQEAIAAARLSHPGIVSVYDTCSDGHHEAIVMELLDASTLRQHLAEHGPLDAETTVRLGLRLLDALEAAHRAGLVHRDIKPSNILLSRDGRVRIADFGIAKADDQTELTQEGTLVGTAAYLAPEQLRDQPVDGRADLYSLGIVLYECVTGRTPFSGETRAAVALARLHSDPTDPRRIRADVPQNLAVVLMRTLERDPADRYSSAADLRAALLQLDGAPAYPPPTDLVEPVVEVEEFDQEESFARSERSWLLPALFIVLIATAIAVAGLLLRESATSIGGSSGKSRGDSTATATPTTHAFDGAIAFDPHGGDGENDDLAVNAIDGDPGTSWRTSAYNARGFFGNKTGVGIALTLPEPITMAQIDIDASDNGWSGSVYILDSSTLGGQNPAEVLDEIDPTDLTPIASLNNVTGPQNISLPAGPGTLGDLVIIWITDLGEKGSNGRFRVHINEVRVIGSASTG